MVATLISSSDGIHFIDRGAHGDTVAAVHEYAKAHPRHNLVLLVPDPNTQQRLTTAIGNAGGMETLTTLTPTSGRVRWSNGTTLRIELTGTRGIVPAELLDQIPAE